MYAEEVYNTYMILDVNQLPSVKQGVTRKIVYVRGAFDILHAGHVEFLEYAKQQGDVLVVGVVSDRVITENKGNDRPIKPEADRLQVINAIRSVDYAFIVPSPTAEKTSTEIVIEILKPHVFVLFNEKTTYTEHFKKLFQRYNIELVLDNSNKKASTTQFVEKIRKA